MAALTLRGLALLACVLAFLVPSARAATPIEEAQDAELQRVRAEVADQIHLSAFDLVDELVYGWTQDPVFDKPTPVVLANVSVPVGLGTGLQALVENHLGNVLNENPSTHVQLAHCPTCTATVVHSGPEGTVVSRGYDNPDVLAKLGENTGRHLLFVDIEAEGTWLVLRARITKLSPDLPIVWSHTLASSASSPALLRESSALKSASEARQEYLNALTGTGSISIPLRIGVRSYARPDGRRSGTLGAPPFLWFQSGVEMAPTNARAWTASLLAGFSFIPQAYQGLMGQARIHRLATGKSRSLTRPDLYLFMGGAILTVWGPSTASLGPDPITSDQLLIDVEAGENPRTTLGTFQVGADLRLGNRIGFSAFLESLPSRDRSQNIGDYTRILGVPFHSWGMEATFWF